ncbi:MAG: hypothetical protein ABEJ90_01655 [Halobacterium sp.]
MSDPLPDRDLFRAAVSAETVDELDAEDLADRAGVDEKTVGAVLSAVVEVDRERYPWHDPDRLHTLYYERGHTQPEIAGMLGCSSHVVSEWMEKLDMSPGKGHRSALVDSSTSSSNSGGVSGP